MIKLYLGICSKWSGIQFELLRNKAKDGLKTHSDVNFGKRR